MKNYFLTFALAVLVVLTGVSLKRSVAGIGGATSWRFSIAGPEKKRAPTGDSSVEAQVARAMEGAGEPNSGLLVW